MNATPLTLYYDGLCPLCSREIEHYRKRITSEPIRFVDIADPSFNALAHGAEQRRFEQVIHVKVGEEMRTGLEAFIALWNRVPGYRWLGRLAETPGFHGLLTIGYHLFAIIRPWLPRRKSACASGTCQR